jgi:galactose mutarotase-like enzyme
MPMHSLENEVIRLQVSEHGAELQSIYHKEQQKEYLWQGDDTYWGRRSPVLFPIVGKLVSNTYYVKGREYHLSQHGFARDMNFELVEQTHDKLKFILKANEKTMMVYPYDFKLSISYKLDGSKVSVRYKVYNYSSELMYFSIGAHPAFNTNLSDRGIEDFYLDFGKDMTLVSKTLDKEVGLINSEERTIVENQSKLDLNYGLFKQDALIFEDVQRVALKNKENDHEIRMSFEQFPLLGVWTQMKEPNCPFVCIEPWFGLADHVGSPKELVDKAYIQSLYPDDKFVATWSIELV